MHAHIDADGSGDYAQIDGQGRYKVRMPFDSGGAQGRQGVAVDPDGAALRRARATARTHPLHKGTEVLLAHIDGDPDRPIIVGAVPNPHTREPVDEHERDAVGHQTASGIRIEMEDLQS